MGEADSWSPCSRPTWLPETWPTWSRPGQTWEIWPNDEVDDFLAETLEDLAEMTETTRTWPLANPYHDDLADDRPLSQLTLKPRSVKLIHH